MRKSRLFILLMIAVNFILISHIILTPSLYDSASPIEEEDSANKYTDSLSAAINSSHEHRTGEIDIIIAVNAGSDPDFNTTLHRLNQTDIQIRTAFTDQQLVAATASPDEIRTIATHDAVTLIGLDERVTTD